MQKKKNSGLAKKVPAIFEGLPDIEESAAKARAVAPEAGEAPKGKEAPFVRGPVCFLIELSPLFVKFALAQYAGGRPKMLKSARYAWGSPEKRLEPDPAQLGKIVSGVMDDWRLQAGVASRLLMRGYDMTFLTMEKPAVPAKQMRDSVLWQLAEKTTLPVEQAELYYEAKGELLKVAALDGGLRDVLLSAFHENGVYPELVTVAPAAYESLNQKTEIFRRGSMLLAEIGDDESGFAVFQKGGLEVFREAALGEDQIIRAMRGTFVIDGASMTIDYEEAGTLLDEFGLPTPNLVQDPNEPKLSQLSARIRPVCEKITQEIRTTLTQFQKQFPSEKISEITLTGAGEHIKGLDVYISAQLGLPVRSLAAGDIAQGLDRSQVALAGLAMADSLRFNFAALEDLWKPRMEKIRKLLRAGVLFSFVAFAAFAGLLMFWNQARKAALGKYQKQYQDLGVSIGVIDGLREVAAQSEARKTILREEVPPMPYLGGVLRELSRRVPPEILITSLGYKKDRPPVLEIKGSISLSGREDAVISAFMEQLNLSPFFEHSSLESRDEKETGGGVAFMIQVELVTPKEYPFERK